MHSATVVNVVRYINAFGDGGERCKPANCCKHRVDSTLCLHHSTSMLSVVHPHVSSPVDVTMHCTLH